MYVMYVCMYVRMYVCVFVCVNICMYIYIYIFIFIYIYIQAEPRMRVSPRTEKICKIKEINGSYISKLAPSQNGP